MLCTLFKTKDKWYHKRLAYVITSHHVWVLYKDHSYSNHLMNDDLTICMCVCVRVCFAYICKWSFYNGICPLISEASGALHFSRLADWIDLSHLERSRASHSIAMTHSFVHFTILLTTTTTTFAFLLPSLILNCNCAQLKLPQATTCYYYSFNCFSSSWFDVWLIRSVSTILYRIYVVLTQIAMLFMLDGRFSLCRSLHIQKKILILSYIPYWQNINIHIHIHTNVKHVSNNFLNESTRYTHAHIHILSRVAKKSMER